MPVPQVFSITPAGLDTGTVRIVVLSVLSLMQLNIFSNYSDFSLFCQGENRDTLY
jgi:hypothetical protein